MNIAIIARLVLASTLLYVSAYSLERVAEWFMRPRRWVWLSALLVSIAIPAVAALAPESMPAFGVERDSPATTPDPVSTSVVDASEPPPTRAALTARPSKPALTLPTAMQLWSATSATLLLLALIAAVRLAYLRRTARRDSVEGVDVLITKNLGPMVTGLFSPAILLPVWVVSGGSSERRMILAHEQQHIDGGDHWLIPLGALFVIAMPWNPLVWAMYARFRLAVETDCDSRVIRAGADRKAYVETLIRIAGSSGGHVWLSPAWGRHARQLELRVRAMTALIPPQRTFRSMFLGIGAVIAVAVACDAATPDPVRRAPSDSAHARMHLVSAPSTPETRAHSVRVKSDATGSVVRTLDNRRVNSPSDLANAMVRQIVVGDVVGVRVNGTTSPEIRTRVQLVGDSVRMVVVSGRVLRTEGDSVVEVVTPAEFAAVGIGKFQVEAAALDPGEDIEIIVVQLDGKGRASRITVGAGANAGLDIQGTPVVRESLDPPPVRWVLTGLPDVSAHLARISANRDSVRRNLAPAAPQSELEPGQIRVTSKSGDPMRVRISVLGRITLAGREISYGRDKIFVEATTPFVVKVAPNEDFSIAFSAPDSTQKFSVEAQGGPDGYAFGYMGSNYSGSTAICWRVGRVSGIGPGGWGLSAADACGKVVK